MGLTIHYQGQLQSEAAYDAFLRFALEFASSRGWPAHLIPEARRQCTRMLQPEDPDAPEVEELYDGMTRGIVLLPHSKCEPLAFEFGTDLFAQDWCKTQFAGADVHATIIHFLRETEQMFDMLDVQDEAGFWDVVDSAERREELRATFRRTREEIDAAALESPGCSVAVITPSGRILDILAA